MLRRGRTRIVGTLALCLSGILLTGVPTVSAQLLRRPIALRNARIHTMDGPVIEKGTLVISGEKIRAVGQQLKLPLLTKKIDANGATITPGLIDAWSLLGRADVVDNAPGGALRRAEDGFDRYQSDRLSQALRRGVTAVYLSPQGPHGICGTGAVIRLSGKTEQGPRGSVLVSQAALSIDLGSDDKPVGRLKTLQTVRKQFRQAQEYQRSLEQYQDELAEYAEKLEQQANKKAKQQAAEKKKAPSAHAAEDDKEQKDEKDKDDKDQQKDQEDKLQKPRRPTHKPDMEILLRALDRELPVRMTVHRSSDILNALELADEFSLDLILQGVVEAHLVAEQIAAARVPVVLGRMDLPAVRRDDVFRRAARHPGRHLQAAGIFWVAGSGVTAAERARFSALNAQLASSATGRDPLRLITSDSARVLRVDDRIGQLKPGLLADCVLWSGDPLDPASRVLQVYVGGQRVFQSDE